MQIRKTGTEMRGQKKQRWNEDKTEGSANCCNDRVEFVGSGFQFDLIQLQPQSQNHLTPPTPDLRAEALTENILQAAVPMPT